MNPVPLLLWLVLASLVGLLPRFLLGWSWWAALGAGLVAVPPAMWLLGTLLDPVESPQPPAPWPQGPVPPLVLEAPEPCPRCGSKTSATVLYGLQAMTMELEQAITDGRVVLAGCGVYAGAPRFICRACREKHGRADP